MHTFRKILFLAIGPFLLLLFACTPQSGETSGSGASSEQSSTTTSAEAYQADGCIITGCSAHLCVNEDAEPEMSTCEWTEAYACYRAARCEPQADGHCGWTATPELTLCLQESL